MGVKTAIYTVVFVLAIAMVVTLLVLWNVYIITDYHTIRDLHAATHGKSDIPATGRWAVLILGIIFFSALLVVLSVFFANLLRGSRFKKQQKDFVNMMTHELKLPMSSIQMFAQTLKQRDASPEEKERFLDCILNDCSRMNLLLDHLLKSQQIERGGLPVDRRRLDVKEFLERFAERWPRPLQMRLESAAAAIADPVLLELALTNLVNNAEKYGKGSIPEVALEDVGDRVNISVRDEGAPIPKKYAKKIFKRFFRMPTRDTRRQSGVGLGLYIVKTIARMNKGTIVLGPVDGSSESRGNRFILSLPRSP